MITPEDVSAHLIDKLSEIYAKPATWKGISARLAAACGEHVTAVELSDLAEQIIASREAKTFPSVPSLLTLVKAIPQSADGTTSVKAMASKPKKTERIGGKDLSFPFGQHGANEREKAYYEAEKRAYRFLYGTEIAAKATAEHWAPGLVDFCTREGREPDYDEERAIIAKVRANDVDVRDFVDKPDPIKPRGNAHGGPTMKHIGNGIGDGLRRMRRDMHEAAERRINTAPSSPPVR